MATEDQKKENRLRLTNLALLSLASSTWDTLGESAFAFSGPMGNHVLDVMEKEMGLEITGEDPHDVMMEISRIFVDEFGFAGDIDVKADGDNQFQVKVRNCINRRFTDRLMDAGVEKPFVCPIMNACQAALRRMDFKAHETVEKWADGNGSIITFELI
jgi:hypothetical protein